MRTRAVLLACVVPLIAGCSGGTVGIRRGTPITHVQRDHGLPDVISDRSGDQVRYYVPADRPEHEWPPDAPRTFYYVDRDLAVTFVSGRTVQSEVIDSDLKHRILRPLVRR